MGQESKLSKTDDGKSARQSTSNGSRSNSINLDIALNASRLNNRQVFDADEDSVDDQRQGVTGAGGEEDSVVASRSVQQVPPTQEAVVTAAHLASDADEAMRRQAQRDAEDQILSNMAHGVAISKDKKKEETATKSPSTMWVLIGFVVVIAVVGAVAGFLVSSKKDDNERSVPTLAPTSLSVTPLPTTDVNVLLETSRESCDEALEMVMHDTTGMILGTTEFSKIQDSVGQCDSQSFPNGIGVWYKIKGNDKYMSLSTCRSNFDTQISIYVGNSCNRMDCVATNDQRTACGAFGDQSLITWFADGATEFYVMVHGVRDSAGAFELSMEEMADHSQCQDAKPIENYDPPSGKGVSMFGSTRVASSKKTSLSDLSVCGDIPVVSDAEVSGVWYTFKAPISGFTQVNLADFPEARVSVFIGSDCNELSCVTKSTTDTAFWTTIAEETYFLFVHGGLDDSGEATVGDFTLSLQPGGALKLDAATPSNIECHSAFALSFSDAGEDGIVRVTNSTQLSQVAPVGSCGPGVQSTANGLWYEIIGTGDGISASVCETQGFQAQLSVFEGESCDTLRCIGGQAYSSAPCSGSFSWFSEEGVPYKILVHGVGERVGLFNLTVAETTVPPEDHGSTCDIVIGPIPPNGVTMLGSTANAMTVDTACDQSGPVSGVWYSVLGTGKPLIASTCNSNPGPSDNSSDAKISILSGSCGALNCVEDTRDVPCGDGQEGQMSVVWNSVVGMEYFVVVYSSSPTYFVLSVDEAPSNLECSADVPLLPVDGSSIFGYTQMVLPPNLGTTEVACSVIDDNEGFGLGLWYRIVSAGTGGNWSLSSCSEFSSFDGKISVFAGDGCGGLECIASNNGYSCGQGSAVTWEDSLPSGKSFYVFVSGTQSFGNVALSLGPENNACATALPIVPDGSIIVGSTVGASTENPDLNCFSTGTFIDGPGVWYKLIGSGTVLSATTCTPETDFDTRISVFSGDDSSCENLICVAGNDNDEQCDSSSTVSWYADDGEVYLILVHGVEGGSFGLSVSETPNDSCESSFPTAIFDSSFIPATMSNSSAVVSFRDPCNFNNNSGSEVQAWFSVPGTGSLVTVSAESLPACSETNVSSSEVGPYVSVFGDKCGSLTCVNYAPEGRCTTVFPSVYGENYNVLVRVPSDAVDRSDANFDLVVTSSNDSCEDSFGPLVVGEPAFGSNVGATSDMDIAGSCEALNGAVLGAGVWYSLIGTGRTVTAHTCSGYTDFDTQITVFAGGHCGSLTCINFKDNNCGKRSWVTFETQVDEVYKILVSGSGTSEGKFVLEVF